ncbi:riboflavin kinase [Amniculicola lignicola CBS 123094]|uniref:Riboflavin kinase n=1 Tax=Amniculicola lignicola CBS 123094 TaxID=1392246 RepID=A0A6A5W9W8_9PLEO|nr:riboflavin kinase [Amniculicola lignicola CBS 123094]
MVGRPNGTRDLIAGPEVPEAPYPIKLRGPVIKGFGRGSKELGIPTANIPLSGLSIGGNSSLESGIYYGYCTLDFSTIASLPPSSTSDSTLTRSSNHAVADLESVSNTPLPTPSRPLSPSLSPTVYPTVLSVGYNPFYANTTRSIEIHILHSFPSDFYGATLSLIILGYIRPEYDYVSKEALVEDIREDIRVARRSLERPAYEAFREDPALFERGTGGEGAGQKDVVGISQMSADGM